MGVSKHWAMRRRKFVVMDLIKSYCGNEKYLYIHRIRGIPERYIRYQSNTLSVKHV